MRAQDCVGREWVAPDSELAAMWASIVTEPGLKDRLLRHVAFALAVRGQLAFTTTALHGLVLLYGPPGTGKTTLAFGVASELAAVTGAKVRLLEVNPHGLMSAEHGKSQQLVHELLTEVVPGRADDGQPTIVVLDEVESMAVARSQASLSANPVDVHRATDAVLTAMDELTRSSPHIVFVATSNFTQGLDAAFLSRADAAIEVPNPTPEAIAEILADTLAGYAAAYPSLAGLAKERTALRSVSKLLKGLDGRSVRKLVAAAATSRLETATDPGKLTARDLEVTAASFMNDRIQ